MWWLERYPNLGQRYRSNLHQESFASGLRYENVARYHDNYQYTIKGDLRKKHT